MKKKPLVSILIINYNGKKFLKDCLTSIDNVNFPRNEYEVILVDNDSQDDSVSCVKKDFPWVKLVESKANLGFAEGNNLAYSKAVGEYIVLLNNDTVVDRNWLRSLVSTAKKNKNVGIVTSKLLFSTPFIELDIISDTEIKVNIYPNSNSYKPLGLIVDNISCSTKEKSQQIWYKKGFYKKTKGNYSSRWTDGHGVVLLPFKGKESETYNISLHGYPHVSNIKTKFQISTFGKIIVSDFLPSREVKQLNITVKREDIKDDLIYLVQNAGSVVFKKGLGRDRGSVILRAKNGVKEFYDFDSSYYNHEEEVLAACGASCLIKREVIGEQIFDPAYFMYYEDVDLSLKVWRKGYTILYQPKSVVYHKHRATTDQQPTSFFLANIEKNHLFLLLSHFPLHSFLIKFALFCLKYLYTKCMVLVFKKTNYYGQIYRVSLIKAEAYSSALSKIRTNLWRMYQVRKNLQKNQKKDMGQIYGKLY
ncbi:MAG: hypothetical protein BroJett025_04760 [Patescibacteria group bacterium]|nr:MAG: hypothetical protein BroJett025_04760 [Patescibacteria group bacterium]